MFWKFFELHFVYIAKQTKVIQSSFFFFFLSLETDVIDSLVPYHAPTKKRDKTNF